MRSVVRTSAFVFALALVSCLDPFAPPPRTYRFDPPFAYRVAWLEVENCSGLRGDFTRVKWFAIPGPFFRCAEGNCQGMWVSPHDIYLSDFARSDSAGDYFTVRHEILHDLLGRGGHPPVFRTCNLVRV